MIFNKNLEYRFSFLINQLLIGKYTHLQKVFLATATNCQKKHLIATKNCRSVVINLLNVTDTRGMRVIGAVCGGHRFFGKKLFNNYFIYSHIIPWVAARAVCWPDIPKVARSRLTECSKSSDLQPALHCAIRGAQGVLSYVGWWVRPVNWIYRFWRHCL